MSRVPRWLVISGALALLALMLLNPAGRQLVIFLLPLGSGIDDFIVIGLLIIAAVIAAPKLPGLLVRVWNWIYTDDSTK